MGQREVNHGITQNTLIKLLCIHSDDVFTCLSMKIFEFQREGDRYMSVVSDILSN